jgi:zinc protease
MSLNRKVAPKIVDAVDIDFQLPPISKYTLNNQQTLYWLNAGVQEVVEITWVFPAGIWYESKNAVAQAVAALMKSGTTTKTAFEISDALEFYGASLKVSANNDYMSITLDALSKHLSAILPIVKDILLNATFPESELSIYKQNTLQRLVVSLKNCEFVANQQIDAQLFGKQHPYGKYTEKSAIEALTTDDLKSFHSKHLNLDDAKIFMSGYVDESMCAMINVHFGNTRSNNETHSEVFHQSKEEHTLENLQLENDPNGVQMAIRFGKKFIKRSHEDFAGCIVVNTILGGYFGSRLMSNIREEKGFTYGIYSSIGAFKHDASLIIHTEVGHHVAEQAIEEISKEIQLLCDNKVDEEELLLVKNYLLGSILGDLDGPFSIMQRWRSLILGGYTEQKFYDNINTYKNITTEEVLMLAQKHFSLDSFIKVVVH